jgi:membrane-associated phospholipid phosphatase
MFPVFANIGDAAVTLPVAIVCGAWLAFADRRLALRWVAALALGMALVGSTKVLYAGWGVTLASFDFRVISGHTMLSTSIWAVTLALLLRGRSHRIAYGAILGLVVGALTGLARVFDLSHTMSESVSGWLVGLVVALFFLRACTRERLEQLRLHPVPAGIGVVLVAMLAYGHQAPFQDLIEGHAPALRAHVSAHAQKIEMRAATLRSSLRF